MPLVFTLCTNKRTDTYVDMFRKLLEHRPKLNPPQINIDFEQATIKAVRTVFPATKLQGCNFHLNQAIVRQMGQLELKPKYEKEIQFASEVRQLMGFAFLPVDKVNLA